MGMRRERELSPYEQFFMLLLSPRTPSHVKKELRGWEARVLDGEADHIPEQYFFLQGALDDVIQAYEASRKN